MFNFFYDSLETLKQLKRPTRKDVKNLTIAIFVVVIIAGIFFILIDGVFLSFYKTFYNIFSG